jgi:hypothetical protein
VLLLWSLHGSIILDVWLLWGGADSAKLVRCDVTEALLNGWYLRVHDDECTLGT